MENQRRPQLIRPYIASKTSPKNQFCSKSLPTMGTSTWFLCVTFYVYLQSLCKKYQLFNKNLDKVQQNQTGGDDNDFGNYFRGPRGPNQQGFILIFHFHPLLGSAIGNINCIKSVFHAIQSFLSHRINQIPQSDRDRSAISQETHRSCKQLYELQFQQERSEHP